MTAQRKVYEAVESSRKQLTAQQFATRQAVKLVEELSELSAGMGTSLPYEMRRKLMLIGLPAREEFDHLGYSLHASAWGQYEIQKIKDELADIQVVVFCLAQALEELDGTPFDIIQEAMDKSTSDIAVESVLDLYIGILYNIYITRKGGTNI